ncbi:MAG: hypothetical protein AUK44_03930 [Porphyromonadaceae bacterium CG2_30_38_12]|nr:MAG: hypothetical protein AUK44_03930 [Porphyromonadaceae bacterium CG2_30_38_12]
MEIVYTSKGQADVQFWKKSGKKNVTDKITALLLSINESPYTGTGKPEPLKHNLSGLWSRRINQEHRLIYEVLPDKIIIHSLRGHYN